MSDIRRFYVQTTAGQLHGRTLLARESNDNPTLVLLHPAPSSGLYFTSAMPLMNERRTLIAPDYPGYGGSDALQEPASIARYASAVLELLENYPVDGPVDILGFHTGCLVAGEMALIAPASVRRLVLCDVPYFTAEQQVAFAEKMASPTLLTRGSREPGPDLAVQRGKPGRQRVHATHDQSACGTSACVPRRPPGICRRFRLRLHGPLRRSGRRRRRTGDSIAGLLDATHAAAVAISNARLVDVEDVTTAVFESGAPTIARHILAALET